jgi:tetratricopeptide (TPR) repeat protein
VTNYNYERFIDEAIESVMAQTVRPHEVIIVDDGSTDGSRARIEALAQRYPVIQAVFNENQGQAAALNAAFARCTGDVVYLLDSDDTWTPDKIEATLPLFDRAGFVQHNLHLLEGVYRSFLVQAEHLRYMRELGHVDFFAPTSALGFRRDVLDKVFPLPDTESLRICADALLTRLALHYSELETLDRPLGRYRVHGENGWYSNRFQGQHYVMGLFDALNRCLVDRGFDRIPLERNCLLPKADGRSVQDVERSLSVLRAMQQEPRHRIACLVLEGQLLLHLGREQEALEAFRRAASEGSSVPDEVKAFLRLEADPAAGPTADSAVEALSPDAAANMFFEMAVCLVRMRRYEEALAAFASVLHHAPERLEIHLNRSDSLRYLGRFDEALAEVDEAERKNPAQPGLAETRDKVRRAMVAAGIPCPAGKGAEAQRGVNVQIQTTSVCNGKCIMCPYLDSWHRDNPGVMTDAVYARILSELRTVNVDKICMYLENEPLVDPKLIPRMQQFIREVPFKLMEISTNAALLTADRAEALARTLADVPHQIWISFHGLDERTYTGIMGLDFHKSLSQVIHLLKLAETMPLNVIVRGSGEPQHESLRHEFAFSEADYRAFWADQFAGHGLTRPPKVNYFRYHDRCGTIKRNNIRLQENVRDSLQGFYCPRVDSWLHFLYTGELCICCMDYHREQIFGDITTQSIKAILESEPYTTMRDMAFGRIDSPANFICKRCVSPNG